MTERQKCEEIARRVEQTYEPNPFSKPRVFMIADIIEDSRRDAVEGRWVSVAEFGNPKLEPGQCSEVFLVRGESYDSNYQDGYELARYFDGEWLVGKQETPCPDVTHYMKLFLPDAQAKGKVQG